MFEKFDEAANDVLAASRHECIRLRCARVLPEHVLLSIARDPLNIAARAMLSMNITADNIRQEVERSLSAGGKAEPEPPSGLTSHVIPAYENIDFAEPTKKVLERANDFRLFFGRDKVAPEHLLLAIVEFNDDGGLQVLEELGANLIFLRRQLLSLIAQEDSLAAKPPVARAAVLSGISEIIWQHTESIANLERLAEVSESRLPRMPQRSEVVLMVFLAYLPDFLLTQVAYQRYLLEETLRLLHRRTGQLDKEVLASIVSQTAQNLRSEVRVIIDHLWSQEHRVLAQVPDEAEHEEIGSVIEDLWWTYSEEIALHEVFDEALDDYRRKHVLNLQKRKLEISQRLIKIKLRLEETLKQCFTRRSLSA
jgi:hypothetical protein